MHLKLIINCLFWIDFEWQKIRHARKKNVQKYELFFIIIIAMFGTSVDERKHLLCEYYAVSYMVSKIPYATRCAS